MTNDELINYILAKKPDVEIDIPAGTEMQLINILEDNPSDFIDIEVHPGQLKSFMRFLKEDPELAFDSLFNMTGMDWGKELGAIYHLESRKHGHELTVRVKTGDRENPVLDTVEDLWFAAHIHECEIYDLFGIRFRGYDGLKRLFLTPAFKGYPLRKDYEDDYMIIRK